jgi:hypothetical protein
MMIACGVMDSRSDAFIPDCCSVMEEVDGGSNHAIESDL